MTDRAHSRASCIVPFGADDLDQFRRAKEGVAVGKAHPFGIEIAFRKMGPTDLVIVPLMAAYWADFRMAISSACAAS